jgi:hypothetical protein
MVVNVDLTAQPIYSHAGKPLVHTEYEGEWGLDVSEEVRHLFSLPGI